MAIDWRYQLWEDQNRTYSSGDQRLIGGASFRDGLNYIEAGSADCGQYAAGGAVGPYNVGSMNDAGAQQPLATAGVQRIAHLTAVADFVDYCEATYGTTNGWFCFVYFR